MQLTQLQLTNFRSYSKAAFRFSPDTTLLLGPNTAGKTNILESVTVVSRGKSFRAKKENEMLSWNNDVGFITADVENEEGKEALEIRLTAGMVNGQKTPVKRYIVNGIPKRQIDFVGLLPSVLFWPEDLELITDSPSVRRAYLDGVLIQIDREYRRNLLSYERGLRQRNRLLDLISEGNATRGQLLFWNQLLIRAGNYLTDARQRYLSFVNTQHIGETSYEVRYDKSVISETRLAQYREEEVLAKSTLVGPHRDDVAVYEKRGSDSMELSRFGSRGQQRLAVLWLKYAELTYIESVTGSRPLLLLDDIFSELDPQHHTVVFSLIPKQQTIITSADPAIVSELKSVPHEIIQL